MDILYPLNDFNDDHGRVKKPIKLLRQDQLIISSLVQLFRSRTYLARLSTHDLPVSTIPPPQVQPNDVETRATQLSINNLETGNDVPAPFDGNIYHTIPE